jgi:branched-chain amino acid aminotransferase
MAEDFSEGAAFVDGTYVPIAKARVPILDAGFIRSDCTYDVVSVWDGKFFRLADHLERFERGMRELRLSIGLERSDVAEVLAQLVRLSGLRDAYVEMIATRGLVVSRDPREFENRFYAYAIPFVWISPPAQQEEGGLHLIISSVERISDRSVDPTVKNFHWGDLTRSLFEAFDAGARHALLVDRDGNVTEGAGFNIFVVRDGALATPERGVLLGITRKTVIELAAEAGIAVRQGVVTAAEVRAADELFLTSTAGGVMPVTMIEGRPVGDGTPGKITTILRQSYWEAHDDPRYATPAAS